MDEVGITGISSGAEIYKATNGFDVVYGEYHFQSSNDAHQTLEEDLATADKTIEKAEISVMGEKDAEKYVLYFEKDKLNGIEEGFAQIVLLEGTTLFWSKSVNLEALKEFENSGIEKF